MSKLLKELGKRIAERDGIQPLRRGQLRPDGYYMGSIATGKSRIPRGAVVNVQSPADETAASDRRVEGASHSTT
jgi:hypothetical protein